MGSARATTVITALALAATGPAAAASGVAYRITDLGSGGPFGTALGRSVNDAGQVALVAGGSAYLYDNGTRTLVPPGTPYNTLPVVNRAGHVAGSGGGHGYLYRDGTSVSVDSADQPSYDTTSVHDVNDADIVVGETQRGNGYLPFVWSEGTVRFLSTPGLGWSAYGVNNAGRVVGGSAAALPVAWTVSGTGAGVTSSDPVPLDLLPGRTAGRATAVNAAGRAAGYTTVANLGQSTATVWDGTAATALPTPAGLFSAVANGLNDVGQTVGTGTDASDPPAALLWPAGGGVLDLNTAIPADSGWVLREAYGINNRGQIVGGGRVNGEAHAFLLTPVPEPSALTLAGAAMVLGRRRRRSL